MAFHPESSSRRAPLPPGDPGDGARHSAGRIAPPDAPSYSAGKASSAPPVPPPRAVVSGEGIGSSAGGERVRAGAGAGAALPAHSGEPGQLARLESGVAGGVDEGVCEEEAEVEVPSATAEPAEATEAAEENSKVSPHDEPSRALVTCAQPPLSARAALGPGGACKPAEPAASSGGACKPAEPAASSGVRGQQGACKPAEPAASSGVRGQQGAAASGPQQARASGRACLGAVLGESPAPVLPPMRGGGRLCGAGRRRAP